MALANIQARAMEQILRDVLAEVSPEEVILVDGSVTAKPASEFNGVLGFGIGAECLLVLPIVLDVLKELASTTTVELAKKWGKDLAEWITGHPSESVGVRELNQFAGILKGRLEKRGFTLEKSIQITDCVVATLASRPKLLQELVKK
jgi:hypothetical protein